MESKWAPILEDEPRLVQLHTSHDQDKKQKMADRRRNNGPPGGTRPPLFASTVRAGKPQRPMRTRGPEELRKIYLKTGVTPSASGSAYFELEAPQKPEDSLLPHSSALKLSCTVHGPRPLPRSVPYSPQLLLTANIKYAPFATRHRRGYIRDSTERDLGAHLETALRGVIIGERWPKTGVDVVITILEGEEDRWWGDEPSGGATGIGAVGGWGMMTVLAGCITAASAALVDAGIDCVDMVSGGTAAIIRHPDIKGKSKEDQATGEDGVIVLDPNPAEHENIQAACVVAYLPTRDEITLLWLKGPAGDAHEQLIDSAVSAATAARTVLVEAITAAGQIKFPDS